MWRVPAIFTVWAVSNPRLSRLQFEITITVWTDVFADISRQVRTLDIVFVISLDLRCVF